MKYNDNGEYKDIYVKSFDTLPVGAEVDFDGNEVPSGWTAIESYSTNEVKTGENWIDGKPLYRKVITGTLDSSGSMDIFTLTNCDVLVNIKGSIVSPSSYKIPFPFYNSANSFISSALSAINHVYVYFSSNFNTSNYKIVLEYTKTTD